jgi:nicotinamidase/pyrazinamidase
MANVVLVADMVRGFLEEGHPLYCGESARRIIPAVRKLLEQEKARGSHLIFVCDNHAPDDREFLMFPPHCIRGSVETEVIPELADLVEDVLPKTRYSAFARTALDRKLRELSPEKIIICGVCTDICVLHTAADARNRDYPVEVHADCVATFDEEAHRFALRHLEKVLGATVVTPAEERR